MKIRISTHIGPALLLAMASILAGCGGSDGSPGAAGTDGKSAYEIAVDNGYTGSEQEWVLEQAGVGPEICSYCHNGEVARNGESHQAQYDELFQQDVVVVSNVVYNNADGNDVVTFNMTKAGADFDCRDADALDIRFSQYDSTTRQFTADDTNGDGSIGFNELLSIKGALTSVGGVCTSTKAQSALGNLNAIDGIIAVYGEDEILDVLAAAHINLGKFPFAALLETGLAGVDYVSAANATGCENCHTTPFYKHGYIRGDVSNGGGLDFYACKVCHVDNRGGGHEDWQIAVDNPQRWAEIWNGADLTPDEEVQYAYKTRLMNDVHMSHSMEFPYPQPINTCATCHAGKLGTEPPKTVPGPNDIFNDKNYTLETCLSCHPVTGGKDSCLDKDAPIGECDPDRDGNPQYAVDTTGMALKTYWANSPTPEENVLSIHLAILELPDDDPSDDCNVCHSANPTVAEAPTFAELHTGYESRIYYKDAADNTYKHYRDAITASIDSVTVDGTDLNIQFSATGTAGGLSSDDIVPTVQVSFYGYDSKDFILSNHTRNGDRLRMEFELGSADNALFTTVTNDPGSWEVILHMAAFAVGTGDLDIPANIASGVISKAEVMVRPGLDNAAGDSVGLNAVSKTVDVTVDATDPFVDNYFKGDSALVKVEDGCNRCHDQLAITFHSGDRGGNIVVCRSCHVVTSGGSHLQGQSRSIDSYVHAIHRFQAFDVDDVDFTDPVEKALYEEHVEFLFPDFAAINCERCHTDQRAVDNGSRGTFDIPDQAKSMPGLLSPTDELPGFDINATPEVVVGPAARACGGCHRAQFIKEDDNSGYVLFNEHTKDFGYRVENDSSDNMLYSIIEYIMGLFQ